MLVLTGGRMLLADVCNVPVALALSVIVASLAVAVAATLLREQHELPLEAG